MAKPEVGDIWLIDLGLAAKVRPCLIFSDYPKPDELALLVVIPHTTAIRGNRWEFPVEEPFLKTGVFHLQQIQPISLPRLEYKLGTLAPGKLRLLRESLARLLYLPTAG